MVLSLNTPKYCTCGNNPELFIGLSGGIQKNIQDETDQLYPQKTWFKLDCGYNRHIWDLVSNKYIQAMRCDAFVVSHLSIPSIPTTAYIVGGFGIERCRGYVGQCVCNWCFCFCVFFLGGREVRNPKNRDWNV